MSRISSQEQIDRLSRLIFNNEDVEDWFGTAKRDRAKQNRKLSVDLFQKMMNKGSHSFSAGDKSENSQGSRKAFEIVIK